MAAILEQRRLDNTYSYKIAPRKKRAPFPSTQMSNAANLIDIWFHQNRLKEKMFDILQQVIDTISVSKGLIMERCSFIYK